MDRISPKLQSQSAKTVAVLACESEKYFDSVLRSIGAKPIVLTKTFMAPEAYLLEALTETVSKFGAEDKKIDPIRYDPFIRKVSKNFFKSGRKCLF